MTVHHGDCLKVLRTLPDCTVDAVVTDPPAGISFMGKSWDGDKGGRDLWVAWLAERLSECLRVLKPGGHAVVWALPRTSGWTHRALEDAGFEVRDCITHLFGSGFPKSLDVGKAIDKAAGAERPLRVNERWLDRYPNGPGGNLNAGSPDQHYGQLNRVAENPLLTSDPATDLAREWDGWGTALKPAAEFWYLARKPLDSTVAATVCRWGTGALNIDACRVGPNPGYRYPNGPGGSEAHHMQRGERRGLGSLPVESTQGRWPANVALTHPDCDHGCVDGCPIAELDRQSGKCGANPVGKLTRLYEYSTSGQVPSDQPFDYGDSGGASRFFPTFRYQAKPSTREKNTGLDDRNTHPTVKPVELMRWLTKLVTPHGGLVLDPFAGSGTTLVAATLEGFDTIGIEERAEYLPIIEGRVRWAEEQPRTLWAADQ